MSPSACVLAAAAAFAPRLVLLLAWIFGNHVKAVFNMWIVPLLGLICLPQTTIVNVDSASVAGIAMGRLSASTRWRSVAGLAGTCH